MPHAPSTDSHTLRRLLLSAYLGGVVAQTAINSRRINKDPQAFTKHATERATTPSWIVGLHLGNLITAFFWPLGVPLALLVRIVHGTVIEDDTPTIAYPETGA
jgi:hypothetical protein